MAKTKSTETPETPSSTTVVVGCKLPNGVVLEVGTQSIVLNGSNDAKVIGGHGITRGVPADFWAAWLEENGDRAMVKNGFIFAHDKAADTKAEAEEKANNATKQEPIDPDAMCNVFIILKVYFS